MATALDFVEVKCEFPEDEENQQGDDSIGGNHGEDEALNQGEVDPAYISAGYPTDPSLFCESQLDFGNHFINSVDPPPGPSGTSSSLTNLDLTQYLLEQPEQTFTCVFCADQFRRMSDLSKHLSYCRAAKANAAGNAAGDHPYVCMYCGLKFKTPCARGFHIKTCVPSKEGVRLTFEEDPSFSCPHCKLQYKKEGSYNKHIKLCPVKLQKDKIRAAAAEARKAAEAAKAEETRKAVEARKAVQARKVTPARKAAEARKQALAEASSERTRRANYQLRPARKNPAAKQTRSQTRLNSLQEASLTSGSIDSRENKAIKKGGAIVRYACYHCDEEFEEKAALREHFIKAHQSSNFNPANIERVARRVASDALHFLCMYCGNKHKEENDLNEHILVCPANFTNALDKEAKAEENGSPTNDEGDQTSCRNGLRGGAQVDEYWESNYNCHRCSAGFDKKSELHEHFKIHLCNPGRVNSMDRFWCVNCGVNFKGPQDLLKHLPYCSGTERLIKEISCGAEDDSPVSVQKSEACSKKETLDSKESPGLCKENTFFCHECDTEFTNESLLREHFKTHSETCYRPHSCMYCSMKVHNLHSCNNHSTAHANPFVCKICFSYFVSLLGKLILSHVSRLVPCANCLPKFANETDRDQHAQLFTDKYDFKCDFCQIIFKEQSQLSTHFSSLAERFYDCKSSAAKFSSQSRLEGFSQEHTELKVCGCNLCNAEFTSVDNLVFHFKSHSGPFICELCQAKLAPLTDFSMHLQTQKNEKKINEKIYECTRCKEKFSEKIALQIHERTLTKHQLLSCIFCPVLFNRKSNLERYVKIHTGEIPSACNRYGACFSQKNSSLNEGGTHTGEKPYTYSNCRQEFSRRVSWLTHSKTQPLVA
ncbi:unnamed protein product [Bemisia tabaci]|uniref:C2H2-type domain-containing protein n=1 Tax=Bemisia tabaci TaxID=7038 RepID=A0A9P0F372_BEMTA|nr:unnamed protein product [Bemisia tabaci]